MGDRERRSGRIVAGAVVLILLLTVGPPFVGRAGTPAHTAGSSDVASTTVTVAPAYVPGTGIADLGPLASDTPLSVLVGLGAPDPAGLEAASTLEYTPGTPEYHQRWTAHDVADRFAPSPASYDAASSYFEGLGLSVTPSPDRWLLLVQGPAHTVASAFGTQFEQYRSEGRTYYSHPSPATLPAGHPWSGVVGLGNVSVPMPSARGTGILAPEPMVPQPMACSTASPLAPCAVYNAYNVSGLISAGNDGTGYRIAVVDVYDASEPQSQLAADLSTFTSGFGLNVGTVHYVYPVPTSRNLNATYTQWGTEEALDLEWARATAPGATIEMTLAPDAATGLYASVDWLVAHEAADVISLSWGEPDVGTFNAYSGACSFECNASSDGSYSILHPVLVAAALEGIGVFAASGDCGAAMGTSGVATSYPASDPAVTGVGGTDLTFSGGGYGGESAWSGNASGAHSPGCVNQGGSGGGWSPFPRPAWQVAPGMSSSRTVRGVPDVALVGGTAVSIVYNGFSTGVYGTSASSPMWAGLAAIADQIYGAPLGWLNPSLYELARAANASTRFHDVTSGTNGYRAGTGWDAVTGIGSPNAGRLLPLLAGGTHAPTALFAELRATPRLGDAPLIASFESVAYNVSSAVVSYDVDFGDGNATWTASGFANHTYPSTGVYLARTVVFLADGNSTTSLPVPIVVGGGQSLNVTLGASTVTPAAGAPVQLNASVTGGTPPFRYTFSFGDGTYASDLASSSTSHVYPNAGAYCASVVVRDLASPPNAGASSRLALAVGGASGPDCRNPNPVIANFVPTTRFTEVPGDVGLNVYRSGGAPPYSVRFVSDDPYVTACQCGIFRTPGVHPVVAFVNDSVSGAAVAWTNITIVPGITGTFQLSPQSGPAPLYVVGAAHVAGGINASVNLTWWDFDDGTLSQGATASHTYGTPGLYVVHVWNVDAQNWSVDAVYLVDVLAPSAASGLALTANITPAGGAPAGTLLRFAAAASGGAGGYSYYWDLGDNNSAFGATVSQTYPRSGGTVRLTVTDSAGTPVGATIPIVNAGDPGRSASALLLSASAGPTSGVTPLNVVGTATATGMPSIDVSWSYEGTITRANTSAHTYFTPGNYTVTVFATDPQGDYAVRTEAITVAGIPRTPAVISGGPSVLGGLAPLTVDFGAQATGGGGAPYAFAWSFGDATSSYGAIATHTYGRPGSYDANVSVTDGVGTVTVATYPILVWNVTPVNLTLDVAPSVVAPGGWYNVTIGADAACSPVSVPTCSSSNVSLALSVTNGTDPSGTAWRVVRGPGSLGAWTVAVRAPSEGGDVRFAVGVADANYSGGLTARITVAPPVAVGPSMAVDYVLWGILGAAAVVAVAAAVGFVVLRRRRPPARSATP